mmetsp:Transcript_6254/g.15055  ORF Transcript_6254/g.15055 Transcript_6254/m.15055 type:complete len:382 (-) Transcript_6254:32-1177(-)|eukprot:CAMPEP_0185811632 /NCGR_PEP_ID=MMETSP1322-20130828/8338_1 /TAXON_ID=265543 /ORGANISM="Minutocellus polymorphus, Strain RCC2270" /LENGTH=381 /DNA_ID=CAMNT_0028508099 /DNA_START=8 /DNA_END=1149 /DNA_ORIENTATION=-
MVLRDGRIVFPILSGVANADWRQISSSLHDAVEPGEIFVLLFLGWVTMPLTSFIYRIIFDAKEGEGFHQSHAYQFSRIFSQAIRVALVVIAADCLDVVMTSMGFDIAQRVDFAYVMARVAYTTWAAVQFAAFKKYLLNKAVQSKHQDKLGRANLLNQLLDLVILMVTTLFLIDLLDVEIGAGFTSVFAIGGVGTLIISLASKDIAEQLLSGLVLHVTDKFYEGDLVRFGDGTAGTVFKIGWMHTVIRLSDNTRTRIPNAQLANKTVTNLSRCTQCQVKTVLYFDYSDMQKLPALIKDIKEDVKANCPALITDGSRPFRVHWTDITDDRLAVTCDLHFEVKPYGDPYLNTKQQALEAIGQALAKNKVELAVPRQGRIQIARA